MLLVMYTLVRGPAAAFGFRLATRELYSLYVKDYYSQGYCIKRILTISLHKLAYCYL